MLEVNEFPGGENHAIRAPDQACVDGDVSTDLASIDDLTTGAQKVRVVLLEVTGAKGELREFQLNVEHICVMLDPRRKKKLLRNSISRQR